MQKTKSTAVNNIQTDGYALNIIKPDGNIMFCDVIGLRETKRSVKRFKENTFRTVLIHGPSGTGKSAFVRAMANELKCPLTVIYEDWISPIIGQTNQNLCKIFDEARRFVKEQGVPLILFFENIDMFGKSEGNPSFVEGEWEFMLQLDTLAENDEHIKIVAETRTENELGDALKARFEKKISVALPDRESREAIFKTQCIKRNLYDYDYEMLDFGKLAQVSKGLTGREIREIIEEWCYMLVDRDIGNHILSESHMEILCRLIAERKAAK